MSNNISSLLFRSIPQGKGQMHLRFYKVEKRDLREKTIGRPKDSNGLSINFTFRFSKAMKPVITEFLLVAGMLGCGTPQSVNSASESHFEIQLCLSIRGSTVCPTCPVNSVVVYYRRNATEDSQWVGLNPIGLVAD
ncbi:hypothetical protein T265_12376 [Opisthorchis viverrini]|uniref:Uncharacterized protein n=1 Tax=Opisthorchis viverrini TaxID=6198 RepID=A0A074ZS22_OPIVI|nr:hypothetical protein T265_12376 [Opisthorchis viverrini]KER18104.1 hypothetical protein T265_12376 [Opisthorchis viverrini]